VSGAVFAHGHWRRRDPLEGLTAPMRAAIRLMAAGPVALRDGLYRGALDFRAGATPATIGALAARGLAEPRFSPLARTRPAFRLTRRGAEIAAEIARRARSRAQLEARP